MKKLIPVVILVLGCDYAPTDHTHDVNDIDGVCVRQINVAHTKHGDAMEMQLLLPVIVVTATGSILLVRTFVLCSMIKRTLPFL